MILRNNKINPAVAEVQLKISYTRADLKHYVRLFVQMMSAFGGAEPLPFLSKYAFGEQDFRAWTQNDSKVFGNLESPWREQMSAWAWRQCVKSGFFIASSTEEGLYFFSEKSIKLLS